MTSLMKKEDDQIIKGFLSRTFFDGWKPENAENPLYGNYKKLEIQVNAACDLKCKYCYYAKYKTDLYNPKIAKHSLVLKNLDMLLEWLTKNGLEPQIEIFSGELFMQDVGFEVLDRVIDWHIDNGVDTPIVVPSNFTFIMDDAKVERVESLLEKAQGRIALSCSVDGKLCDANRPFRKGDIIRDDAYYDKMFKFVKKWRFAFHPMVYSAEIEHWKDNFLWYQENMKKHDIPFVNIYLLEVRNAEWNKRQLREFYKFMRFLVNWTWNMSKDQVAPEMFPQYVFDNRVFNMFSMFGTVGRGVGCSMQSTIQLRLGDLTTSVCHRAAYKPHNLWKFVTDGKEIVDIKSLNHNLAIAVGSLDFKASPFCSYCSIRDLCNGQCLGAMYETTGDPFLPIPTVCALEHAKVAGMMDELKALGLYHHFYSWAQAKQYSMKVYDILHEGGKG